jgi:hypothetical protein
MARLDHPLVDRCRTITVAPALTHRRQRKRRRRLQLWLLEGLLPGRLGVPVIAAAGQQFPKGGGGPEGEARMVGVDRLLVASPGLIDITIALMEAAKQHGCPWRPVRILRLDRLPVGGLGPSKVALLGVVGGQAQGRLGGDLPAGGGGRLLKNRTWLGSSWLASSDPRVRLARGATSKCPEAIACSSNPRAPATSPWVPRRPPSISAALGDRSSSPAAACCSSAAMASWSPPWSASSSPIAMAASGA